MADIEKTQTCILAIVYFFVSLGNNFQIVDQVNTQLPERSVYKMFYDRWLYNFSAVIMIIFDSWQSKEDNNLKLAGAYKEFEMDSKGNLVKVKKMAMKIQEGIA